MVGSKEEPTPFLSPKARRCLLTSLAVLCGMESPSVPPWDIVVVWVDGVQREDGYVDIVS
jgi:hypothetical protein